MKTRRIPLIIGLVLALGTGALLLGYLTSLRPATTAGRTEAVLVASHDIPARAAATSDLFSIQQRDVGQVDSDAISDAKDLAGTYTLVAIPAGGVATHSKIGLASAATLPARLPIGMRAASISIDNVKGVAGLITPGDRVDVIAVPSAVAGETPRGLAILRGVLVLAMGSNVETVTSAPGPLSVPAPSLSTVTLALTPDQVDRLTGADLTATLRLALRNPKEPTDSLPPEVLTLAAQSGTSAAAPARVPSTPAAPPQSAPAARAASGSRRGVIVIDGDHVDPGGATSP
jgi:pilus assembly protein CpaB